MKRFACAHAEASDWRAAVQQCSAGVSGAGNLGFLYVTDFIADHVPEILAYLREHSGVQHWVGTVGIGVCASGTEYLDEPAMVVMAGEFEPDSFTVFSGVHTKRDARALPLRCGESDASFAIVHADPGTRDIPEIIEELAGRVDSGFLVGGLTSSRSRNLQIADSVSEGGISGVAFSDSVVIATRLTQGCTPMGPKHRITRCQRNILQSIDDRPALEVFREDIGDLGDDLNRIGSRVFAGLPIPGSDTGDYLVRNLVGIDPESQLVAIGDIVQSGGSIMFCRRDRESAQQDMKRMLKSIREGLYTTPRGGVYYSCLGRGEGLFGEGSAELRMIADELGEFPLAGFFCNGEISHNRLYGYTGVLTLFL